MTTYEIDGTYAGGLYSVRARRVTLVFDESGVALRHRHGVLWQAEWAAVERIDVDRDDEGSRRPSLGGMLLFGLWAWVAAQRRYDTTVTVVTANERPAVWIDLLPDEVDAVFARVRRLIPAA